MIILLQFMFLAGVIVGAGAALSRYADVIAERTGLGRLVVGSVLLASITSLPELSVDIACVRQGDPDLGVGDLLGSCLMNLLILAVLDLSAKSRGKMFSSAASGHALGGIVSIVLASIVAIALIAERTTRGLDPDGFGRWCRVGSGRILIRNKNDLFGSTHRRAGGVGKCTFGPCKF